MAAYRGARIQDLDSLTPLVEAYARERATYLNQKLRDNFMEHARNSLTQVLEHPAAFVCVAEEDGAAVGYAAGLIQEPPPLFADEPFVFISDLYVQPAARGQGIGTALVERVRGWGLMRGMARCSMVVPLENPAAVKIAGKVGARPLEGLYYWHSSV